MSSQEEQLISAEGIHHRLPVRPVGFVVKLKELDVVAQESKPEKPIDLSKSKPAATRSLYSKRYDYLKTGRKDKSTKSQKQRKSEGSKEGNAERAQQAGTSNARESRARERSCQLRRTKESERGSNKSSK